MERKKEERRVREGRKGRWDGKSRRGEEEYWEEEGREGEEYSIRYNSNI